ncbi:hypothetical protein EBR78_07120 [bacterium]|nr:hypothetical protein [bacterium]
MRGSEMKIQRSVAALVVVLGMTSLGHQAFGEHRKGTSAGKPKVRTKTVAKTTEDIPKSYQEIVDALKEVDGKEPVVKACGSVSLLEDGAAEQLKAYFETVQSYRTALNNCEDELDAKFRTFMDEYLSRIKLATRTADNDSSLKTINKPKKALEGLDSALRFHAGLKALLEKRTKELSGSVEKFSDADKELKKALDGIYKLCAGKDFKPSEDAESTLKIDSFNEELKQGKFKDACELKVEEPAAPAVDADDNSSTQKEEPEHETAPPAGDGNGAGEGQAGGADANASQLNNVLPNPSTGNAGIIPGFTGFNNGLDPAQAFNPTEREDALLGQLLALAQNSQRPNEIGGSPTRDNSRSFSAPPVSVSPQPGNQSQQQPQQQPYPPMQMPPFPYGMMQPPAPTPIPAELLAPRVQEAPRANPMDAAANASLMEIARMNQQMMQMQMANAMGPRAPYGPGYGTPNVGRLRQARTAFRGAQGSAGNRLMSRGRRTISRGAASSRVR